jgi:hypothetical protein
MKISKSLNSETNGDKGIDSFFNHLVSFLYSLNKKFLALDANHMCKK